MIEYICFLAKVNSLSQTNSKNVQLRKGIINITKKQQIHMNQTAYNQLLKETGRYQKQI